MNTNDSGKCEKCGSDIRVSQQQANYTEVNYRSRGRVEIVKESCPKVAQKRI